MTAAAGDTVAGLARRMNTADLERQQSRNDLSTHEKICAERYEALKNAHDDMKTQLVDMALTLKNISDTQISNEGARAALLVAGRPRWWHQLLGAALVALIGWMGSTIWSMQTDRLNEATRRELPAASVTVNPPQVPPPTLSGDNGQTAN